MRYCAVLASVLLLSPLPAIAAAQVKVTTPRAWTMVTSDDDERAVIGINTADGTKRDTLGLLIMSVTPDGPADRAGIEEGNRIQAINGVRLTLSSGDAGEDDMHGILSRRLTREMRKVKAGDEVELRVYDDGQVRTIRIKTIPADELPSRTRKRVDEDDRAVVGIGLGGSGSKRDTIGIFISSVTEDGPAERAGIEEGNRIASINGVDLRVPTLDAGDPQIASIKSNRFRREMAKVKPGDDVELRVYSDGGYRTVRVRAASAAELYKEHRKGGFGFWFDGGRAELTPMPPIPPTPPMPSVAPRIRLQHLDELEELEHIEPVIARAESAARRAEARARVVAERARVVERAVQRATRAPAYGSF